MKKLSDEIYMNDDSLLHLIKIEGYDKEAVNKVSWFRFYHKRYEGGCKTIIDDNLTGKVYSHKEAEIVFKKAQEKEIGKQFRLVKYVEKVEIDERSD